MKEDASLQHLDAGLPRRTPCPQAFFACFEFCLDVIWLLQVHVVELKLSREEASRRHEAAVAAAAAGLEITDLGAEASQSLLGEASFMPEHQQQQQQPAGQVGSVIGTTCQNGDSMYFISCS